MASGTDGSSGSASTEDDLKAENARLVAEMASMKKKIMVAFKKQQAELQAAEKLRVEAEERAAATESELTVKLDKLEADLTAARLSEKEFAENQAARHEETLQRAIRAEEALVQVQKELQSLQRAKEVERDAERVSQKTIQGLEKQLMAAANQVTDALSRVAATQEENSRLQTKISASNEKAELAEGDAKAATDRLQALQNSHMELSKAQEDATSKVKAAEENARHLVKDLQKCQDQIAGLQSEAEEQGKQNIEIGKLQEEVARLRDDLANAQKLDSEVKAELSNDTQEKLSILKRKEEEVDELRKSLEAALSKSSLVDDLQSELHRLREELASKEGVASTPTEIVLDGAGKEAGLGDLSELQAELKRAAEKISAQAAELVNLESEIEKCRAYQTAAEESASRVSAAAANTEERIQTLEVQLAEARAKGEEDIKSRDEQYSDLDSKFGRLQKRAKQRIQELTKEKEDAEAQVVAAGEKTAQALSKQAALEEELARIRQHSNEAIAAAEADKEKLRSTNASLTEEIEDLRRTLEVKEITLNESRRLAAAKEQSLLEVSSAAQEEKEQQATAMQELTERIQKVTEDYETRLKELQVEIEQNTTNLSELKTLLGAKEQQLAELESATSGEIARLTATIEEARGDTLRLEEQHRAELESWETNMRKMKKKSEAAERAKKMGDATAAEIKNKLETDLESLRQALGSTQNELATTRSEAERLSVELAAYKVRAAALLQKKNAELEAAKDAEYAAAQAASLQAAKQEAQSAVLERDNAVHELDRVLVKHEQELAVRAGMIMEAQQRVRELATRQEAVRGQMEAQNIEWQAKLDEVEAAWKVKYAALEERVNNSVESQLNNQIISLQEESKRKQTEYEGWKDMANQMLEEKEAEIRRLLNETANLQTSLTSLRQHVAAFPRDTAAAIAGGFLMPDGVLGKVETSATATAAEQQILLLARQQAQREEEVAQCRRHIQALQDELADMERENRLHAQQESLLKDELRNMERSQNRQGVDMTYLKNVILKLLQTGEVMALLPVIAMLLQFSPDELKKCHEVYQNNPP